jgi:hypothetical protein
MKTLSELCATSGDFPPERLQKLEQALIEDHQSDMPWYLRGIVGFGAWLASLFLLAFVIVLIGDQDEHRQTIGIVGSVLLIIAVIVGRQPWGIFAGQCALAISLAAQAMMYYGFVDEHQHPMGTITAFSLIFAAALYFAFPNFLSRLLTCFFALQLTLMWIYTGSDGEPFSTYSLTPELSGTLFLYWGFHLAAICGCFLYLRYSVVLAPLGYAFIGSLAAWQIENLFNVWHYSSVVTYSPAFVVWIVFHIPMGMTALTLFGVSVWAAGGVSALREKAPLFAGLGLALFALVSLGAGGILIALLFMLLGFALQHHAILGLGLLLLPLFLTHYYFNLHLDLLAKSGVLVCSGVLLLLLRSGLARWAFANYREAA